MTRFIDEPNRQIQMLGRMVDLTGKRVLDVGCDEDAERSIGRVRQLRRVLAGAPAAQRRAV